MNTTNTKPAVIHDTMRWVSISEGLPPVDLSDKFNTEHEISIDVICFSSQFGRRIGRCFHKSNHWTVDGFMSTGGINVEFWCAMNNPSAKPFNGMYAIDGLSIYNKLDGRVLDFVTYETKAEQEKRNHLMTQIVSLLNGEASNKIASVREVLKNHTDNLNWLKAERKKAFEEKKDIEKAQEHDTSIYLLGRIIDELNKALA